MFLAFQFFSPAQGPIYSFRIHFYFVVDSLQIKEIRWEKKNEEENGIRGIFRLLFACLIWQKSMQQLNFIRYVRFFSVFFFSALAFLYGCPCWCQHLFPSCIIKKRAQESTTKNVLFICKIGGKKGLERKNTHKHRLCP